MSLQDFVLTQVNVNQFAERCKVGTQRTKKFNTIKESTKIFNLHISYNKKFQDDINFCTAVKNIYNVAKLCRVRDLYLEVKITTFKSLNI